MTSRAPRRVAHTTGATCLTLVLLGGGFAPAAGGGQEPLPYRLEVRVDFGSQRGPERIAVAVERALVEEIERRGCVREVAGQLAESGDADLGLRILLRDLRDETIHTDSIANRNAPNAGPEVQDRLVALFDVAARATLVALPGEEQVRVKRYRRTRQLAPRYPGEDVARIARQEALDELVREIKQLVCGGSRKKLRRDVESARSSGSAAGTR